MFPVSILDCSFSFLRRLFTFFIFLLVIVLFLLQFKVSDYPFGIFKLFLLISMINYYLKWIICTFWHKCKTFICPLRILTSSSTTLLTYTIQPSNFDIFYFSFMYLPSHLTFLIELLVRKTSNY